MGMITRVYFVRHAQPNHLWEDDRSRPLSDEGKEDSKEIRRFFRNLSIDAFYCSPYKRSIDTIADAAQFFHKDIVTDERLRERENGPAGNSQSMFMKRWSDKDFHEEGGESIHMV